MNKQSESSPVAALRPSQAETGRMGRMWVWLLLMLVFALVVLAITMRSSNMVTLKSAVPDNRQLISDSFFWDYLIPAAAPAYAITAALILSRRPKHLIGWLALWLAASIPLREIAWMVISNPANPEFHLPAAWLYQALGTSTALTFILILYLFPEGRIQTPAWRAGALLGIAGFLLMVLAPAPSPEILASTHTTLTLSAGVLQLVPFNASFLNIGSLLLAFSMLIALIQLISRWLQSGGATRLQLKWFIFSGAIVVTLYLLSGLYMLLIAPTPNNPFMALVIVALAVGLPAAMGVAVLHYRLYGIDLIINQTLVYSLVALSLALVYLGGILLLQQIAQIFLGRPSDLAIVIATMLSALLFNPLRKNIQNRVDRRFYRRKVNLEKVLTGFSTAARDEVDLAQLSKTLVGMIEENIHPISMGVWLRFSEERRVVRIDLPGSDENPGSTIRQASDGPGQVGHP